MCVPGAGTLVAGRYLLQSRLAAASGREEAWRADDLVRGCPVAVRLPTAVPPVPAGDFLAAARKVARVGHPGIVRILDDGQAGPDGTPFLVTELPGTASVAVVLRAGRLDPAWVLEVIFQVSSALAAVHALGLVHQDIQPGNLLLRPGGTVTLAGFWLPGAGPSLDSAAGYRAPELAAGAPATPAADLYSLGAVAWECLTGALPGWPRPGLPGTVPPEVAHLVTDLVAVDPAERPAGAGPAAARARDLLDHPMRPLAGEAGPADGALLRKLPPELRKSA
jgi:serine/threonine-protein kinase